METFLLPSLIGGLLWMSRHVQFQPHNNNDAMMRIFHEVILTSPSSGDAHAMHSTILAMVSSRLEKCFCILQRREASREKSMEPLLQAIKSHQNYERSMHASMKELEQWTNAPHSTHVTAMRHTVQQLSQWASTASIQPNPPSYTHRQVYVHLKHIGANALLPAILNEVKAQTEAGNGAAALDVGVSIICAPTVDSSPIPVEWIGSSIAAPLPRRNRANLREMLKHHYDDAADHVATDPLYAETIVRLHRRVEAQLASIGDTALHSQNAVMGLPSVNIADIQSQGMSDDINKAIEDAAAASIAEDISTMDNKALQRSMEELTGTEGLDLTGLDMGTGANGNELGDLPGIDLADMDAMDMDMDLTMGAGGDDDWGLDFENM